MSDPRRTVVALEDSDDGFHAFRRRFRTVPGLATVQRSVGPDPARDCLSAAIGARCPMPDAVGIEVLLAGGDGRVLLDDARADPQPRPIPVLLYRTLQRPEDVRLCLGNHANTEHVKPRDFDPMERELQTTVGDWTGRPLNPSVVS